MAKEREVMKIYKSTPTMEGAGVRLQRAFGFHQLPLFDPFLMFDDFGSSQPDDFKAGFPWHPHRGMETITYVLEGRVEHTDSLGNSGVISGGDLQWMTAGSGIIHQELPAASSRGAIAGFQLWTNLPSGSKMTQPKYQNIDNRMIPEIELEQGARARVIAGRIGQAYGPVQDSVIDPEFFDMTLLPNSVLVHPTKKGHKTFAYIIQGSVLFGQEAAKAGHHTVLLFNDGENIRITAGKEGLRLLLVSGKPLNEAVAWHGPIVMNTNEELEIAFQELENNTFIKHA